MFVASWAGHQACAIKVGCEVVSGVLPGTEKRIRKMRELKAAAFMATPASVLGMADTSRHKLGIDLHSLGIMRFEAA